MSGTSLFVRICFYFVGILISRFKRTLVAYPNNEFVRIFDWAKTSNILMKSLDSTVKEYCKLCKAALTLEHLISKFHAKKFHEKYNADPPEIAKLLEPEIYKQFIDPTCLNQEELNGISNAMSYMEQTSDGFRFLPLPIDNRKRHQITVNVQESNKRSKKMQLYYFGSV
uniref:C2H2-type domain-containing protein n=1 Tax=Panagrolaimus superbus TaxID=310955 RepID=A0A914Y541_9BILA